MKITSVRVACVLGAVALTSILSASCNGQGGQEEPAFRQISLESYEDKVAGGWLGQAIGVLLGEPTEFKWMGLMIPFDMEDFCRLKPMPEEFVADGPGWENQAEMIAYFQTTLEYALTGGIYELQLEPRLATWKITRMRISSTWGWAIPHSDPPFLKEPFGAGTLHDGRPPLQKLPKE